MRQNFKKLSLTILGSVCLLSGASNVHAATTVFADNVITATATNPNATLGNYDGTAATFSGSDFVLLDYGTDIGGQNLDFNFTETASSNEVLFFVLFGPSGFIFADTPQTNPAGGNTTFFYVDVQPGFVTVDNSEFASACASAAGGCSGVFVRRSGFSEAGGSFSLDAVAATPEPQTWGLMLLGFLGLGLKLKQMKRSGFAFGDKQTSHVVAS